MRVPVTIFLSLLVVFGVAASAHTQGIEWETLNAEATLLYQQSQYDRAVVVAKQAEARESRAAHIRAIT